MQTKNPRSDQSKPSARPYTRQNNSRGAAVTFAVQLLDVIDALPFYAMLVDESHRILLANDAVRKQLGALPEDILGGYCPKVIHGLDGPFPGCPLEEAAEKGRAVECELLDKDSGRWVMSAIYPTRALTPEGKRVFFHVVTDITDRKQAEEHLKMAQDQLRSLSAHLESAREEEKNRIAHSLHDETSQVVSSLTAYLEAAFYKLPSNAGESRAMLEKSRQLAGRILDDLHRLIYELHPFPLHELGLVPAVASLVETSLEPTGIKVRFQTKGKIRRLPPDQETVIFRVIQEAVSNIARHAKAGNAELTIYFRKATVKAVVADDGLGFDVDGALSVTRGLRGFGLLSMKERIESVGGSVGIRSRRGGGTEITIEVPARHDRLPSAV